MDYYPNHSVKAIAVIGERIAETAFRAVLPNGKQTVAFVELKKAHLKKSLRPGTKVHVTICPADFNRARIDDLL